jgi:hypothetical protein
MDRRQGIKAGGLLADRGWLYEQYVTKGRSTASIADEAGCEPSSVWYRLKKFDIPRRPRTLSKHRIDENGRECTICGQYKPWSEFWSCVDARARGSALPGQARTKDCRCIECHSRPETKAYLQEYRRVYQLVRRFNITPEQYTALLEAQGGVCALCRKPERAHHQSGKLKLLAVDHDRRCCPGAKSCGRCIRGLLCFSCNVTLGKLECRGIAARLPDYLDARPIGLEAAA